MVQPETTIFIIDDEDDTRSQISLLFKPMGVHVKTFREAREFLEGYDSSFPGCLVLEIRLPGISGLELQEMLLSQKIHIPIIFLSRYGDVPMAVRAMKMGALDFLEKPFNTQLLLERIQQGIRLDRRNRQEQAESEDLLERYDGLTERERQIMDFIVLGRPNKVIAIQLGLSQKTVEFHRSHVMEKMKAESMADLVRIDFRLSHLKGNPRMTQGTLPLSPQVVKTLQ
jgi:two-component system, LuxR family, response regulator FixJ